MSAENEQIQLKYEQCLSESLKILLRSDDESCLSDILQLLQRTTNVDRAYLFKNHTKGQKRYISQTHESCAPGITSYLNSPDLQNVPHENMPSAWLQAFKPNKTVSVIVEELPEPVKSILTAQQVKSILVIPINLHGTFYGAIGFDACRKQRSWSPHELRLLQNMADIIGISIQKWKKIKELKKVKEAIELFPDIILRFDQDGRHLFVTENISDITGIDAAQFIGKSHRELGFPPNMCKYWEDSIKIVFETQSTLEREFTYQSRQGPIIYNWRIVPELSKDGEVSSVITISRDITERKKTEYKLKESEEKHRRLFETMILGVVYQSPDGSITSANPAAERILGISQEHILGKKSSDSRWKMINEDGSFVHHTEHPSMIALRSGKIIGPVIKGVFRPESNSYVWLSITAYPLFRPDEPRPFQVYATFEDITEKKQAETVVRETNERFRMLFDYAPVPYQSLDQHGNFLEVNKLWLETFGYTRKEVIGKNFRDFLTPEYFDVFKKRFHTFKQQGIIHTEFDMFHKNGEKLFIVFDGRIGRNDDQSFKQTHCILKDETESRHAKRALRESERRFRTLFDESPISIIIHDKDTGKIVDANKATFENLGINSLVELQQKAALYQNSSSNQMALKWIQKTATEGVQQFEWKNLNDNNEEKWEYVTLTPITINEVQRILATIIDITQRKRAEAALIESQRLSAIGELASGVAHDFNNALQGIFGNLELALLENLSDDARTYIETVKTLASDAAARVKQLQRFGKIGDESKDFMPISIKKVVNDAIDQTRHLWKDEAEKRGRLIELKSKVEKNLYIYGNQADLRSVFFNLIKNSTQAMPRGGLIIIVAKRMKNEVLITFRDNGIGMNETIRKRVFQPFFSTKGFEQGKGLGMSIAYSIIKEHHGDIYISQTAPEQGTTFEIRLPYTEKPLSTSSSKEISYSGKARILWVDDEKEIRKYVSQLLPKLGHIIDVAASGHEALEYLEKQQYDLLISDIGMPGMSGWHLAKKIKGKYPQMKLAVVTGWGSDISPDKKQTHGVGYILGKPIKLEEIQNLINEVLQF